MNFLLENRYVKGEPEISFYDIKLNCFFFCDIFSITLLLHMLFYNFESQIFEARKMGPEIKNDECLLKMLNWQKKSQVTFKN